MHQSSPNWVLGEGSDHLQLIKFWPSRVPGKGVCGGTKIFGSALLQPACSVCVSPSAFFQCFFVGPRTYCLSTEFCENRLSNVCINPANKQTNKHWWNPNLLGRGKEREKYDECLKLILINFVSSPLWIACNLPPVSRFPDVLKRWNVSVELSESLMRRFTFKSECSVLL